MDTFKLLELVTVVRQELYGDRVNISDKEIQMVLVEAKIRYKASH